MEQTSHIAAPIAVGDLSRLAFAQLPAGIIIVDRQGTIVQAGGRLLDDLRLPATLITGRPFTDVLSRQIELQIGLHRALQGERIRAEFPYAGRMIQSESAPLIEGGELAGTITVWTDVTGWHRRHAALQDSHERALRLASAAVEGIAIHEPNGTVHDVNESLGIMFGYTQAELVGEQLDRLFPPSARKLALAYLGSEGVGAFETQGLRKDGTVFPIEIFIRTIVYQGRSARVTSFRDITERMRAEQALRESEARYRELYDKANDIIYTHDLNGLVTSINQTAEQIMGYSKVEALTMNIMEIVVPEHRAHARQMTADRIAGRGPTTYEVDVLTKDGRRLTLEVNTRLIVQGGKPVGIQGIARDVSERKRMIAELQQRLRFEDLIMRISKHFISRTDQDLDGVINAALREIGEFAGVDRCYIFLFSNFGRTIKNTHEWCAEGVSLQASSFEGLTLDTFPWVAKRFARREIVHVPRVRDLPADAHREREYFEALNIRSFLAIPMIYGRVLIGFLGLDSVRDEKVWPEWSMGLLKILGEIFVNAMQRRKAEEALRESEERYRLAALGANDGLWDWDLRGNEVYFSTRWKEMLGYREAEIADRIEEWLDRLHPDDAPLVREALAAHLEGRVPHFQHEHRIRHRDGSWRWMLTRGIAIRDASGKPTRMAGSQTDITDRKRAEERLLHDAFHDSLTGLPNRALFLDRLERAIRRSERHADYCYAVLFLDMDRFKNINDGLGHGPGDELLVSVAGRLKDCLGPGDTVARLGGDEFAVLLEDITDAADATRIADHMLEELARPFALAGRDVFITASIGIALGKPQYHSPDELLRDADTAMYRAKAKGKACYVVFDDAMHARAVALLHLEADLRLAVERSEFALMYQPIINLSDGQIAGFEALLRWRHPSKGIISSTEFIPIAEETGLIVPIGLWALREAAKQTRQWQEAFPMDPPLSISVNLSPKQFMQVRLTSQIRDILAETGLDPRTLRLEITESVFMDNADQAAAMAAELRGLNIRLHIDDFGTGYSSLSYLYRFPVDTLKIDRSFVSRIGDRGENSEIVSTIASLAANLGMTVIAEGVESPHQLKLLRAMQCQQAQGYFFSPPLPPEAATELLIRAPRW